MQNPNDLISSYRFFILILVAIVFLLYFNLASSTKKESFEFVGTDEDISSVVVVVSSPPQKTSQVSEKKSQKNQNHFPISLLVNSFEMHPSCEVVQRKIPEKLKIPSHYICYKHGGHSPGCSRRGVEEKPIVADSTMAVSKTSDQLEWKFDCKSFKEAQQQIRQLASTQDERSITISTGGVKKNLAFGSESRISQIELTDVVVIEGQIYSSSLTAPLKIPVSGIYSMISNNWPQTLTTSVTIYPLVAQANASSSASSLSSSSAAFALGYWQSPTDFISSYHVTVEVTLTMVHSFLRASVRHTSSLDLQSFWKEIVVREYQTQKDDAVKKRFFSFNSEKQPSVVVVTTRPVKAMWGFKSNSCKYGAEKCLGTVWASVYVTLFSFIRNFLSAADGTSSTSSSSISSFLSSSALERAKHAIVGLDNNNDHRKFFFKKLVVGYPTFCEPMWGPDPILIHEAQQPKHKGKMSESFSRATTECDLVLWISRSVMIEASRLETKNTKREREEHNNKMTPRILYATRKGDWARDVLNEDQMLRSLDSHLKEKFPHAKCLQQKQKSTSNNNSTNNFCHIEVAKFSGKLENQIMTVARESEGRTSTIFIAAHGANIIPSLFLSPNCGVITLEVVADESTGGFYPYGVFPSWLHWRRVGLDRKCNRRLEANVKKCKVRSLNNDDLFVNDFQIKRIVQYVDDIIELQTGAASRKVKPYDDLIF